MGQITTIASIYPLTVGILRPQFVPDGQFYIEGLPEGASAEAIRARVKNPEILVIRDQKQFSKAPISHIEVSDIITAEQVADDFIVHATKHSPGMSAGCHPGVWICRGKTDPDGITLPTVEEVHAMREIQSKYFLNRMEFANGLATDPNTAKAIVWIYRVAAMALGREPEWLHPPSDLDIQECPYCRKSVPRNAAVCGHCSNVVNPDLFARLERQKRDAIKEAQKTVAA